ncbi:ULK kinase [Fusarium sp. NRRL 25303]|nr:ULK kinase [Fusarium sp. NRRL 25303]
MDSDILAVLFPLETNAARAFRLPENAPFHHEPSTPLTDWQTWDIGIDWDDYEHLKIHFQHPRRNYGFPDEVRNPDYKTPCWTIGNDPTSTVYLGEDLLNEPETLELSIYRKSTPYILLSRRSSKEGSSDLSTVFVSFDDQHKSKPFYGTSILAFQPGSIAPWMNVTISIGPISFRITFPNHNKTSPDGLYMQNLDESASWFAPVGYDVGSRLPLRKPQRYYRGKRLGQGGFGAVYIYTKYTSGRKFAGKAIESPENDPNGHNTLEKVKKEFTYMSRDSRFIVEALGIVTDDSGSPVILMPIYLGSLAECSLTHEESVTAFKQILMGLKQLKKFDILHRDIKPGNILIRKQKPDNFQIVLADFGLAGKYTERSEYFYGSAYYKAPEVFGEVANEIDDRSDVWSTGIIILEKMYGLDKKRHPKPNCDSEREEWYANWQKEVKGTVESINCESEPGDLMKIMLKEIFVDFDKRVDAKRCLGTGSRIKLWRRHSIPMRWWKSWVTWVDEVPEMRKKASKWERARKRNAINSG